jgi:electron transfer flavoprotein beta subunit
MKIVVAYKWAANPQDAQVDPDGIIDWSRAKNAVSEYDPVAFELARKLADSCDGEVVGLTVGAAAIDSTLARKAALSRGLDRLVMVADDRLLGADGTRLAAVLAGAVRTIGAVDVVIAGESSVDVGDRQVAMTLAGQLGWPGLNSVRIVAVDGVALSVGRELSNALETLIVEGPVVLAATADAAVPRVPGMKDILGAAKKPVQVLELDTLDVPAAAAVLEPMGASRPESGNRQRVMIDASDVATAAAQLTAALRQSGVL